VRSYHVRPRNPTGYFLDLLHPWFWVIEPEATTNKYPNPSWETDDDNWTYSEDGTDAGYGRLPELGFRGLYGFFAPISSDGTYVQLVSTTNAPSGTTTTVSFFVRFYDPTRDLKKENVRVVANGTTFEPSYFWAVGGGWWRVGLTLTPSTNNPVGLRVIGNPGEQFVVDCAQWEDLDHWTTYCDGDEMGLMPLEQPVPFVWNGTPHASTSSRTFQTHAGGKITPFSEFGFNLVALEGLGMPEIGHARQDIASADGSLYKTSRRGARTFSLGGQIVADTPQELSRLRSKMMVAFDVARSGLRQPLLLYIQKHDGERPVSEVLQCVCTYDTGLEVDHQSEYDEDLTLVFTADRPALPTLRHISAALLAPSSTSGVMSIRDPSGEWSVISGALGGGVMTPTSSRFCGLLRDGTKYMALNNGLAFRNESTEPEWEAGTSANITPIQDALELSSGLIALCGNFTQLNVTAANRIALVDSFAIIGATVTPLGTGLNGIAYQLAEGPQGHIYVCGDFSTANGVGISGGVAYWNGTTFVDMGAPVGIADIPTVIAVDAAGKVYVTGPGDSLSCSVARWEGGTTWTSIGIVAKASQMTPYKLVPTIDGYLYLFGDFTQIDDVACNGAAVWNGGTWQPLSETDGIVLTGASNPIYPELAVLGDGTFGPFTRDDTNPLATYLGTTWRQPLMRLPSGDNDDFSLNFSRDGSLVVTHERVSVVTPNQSTFENPYSTAAWLQIHLESDTTQAITGFEFSRPIGRLQVDFDVLSGEEITIQIGGGGVRVRSDVRPVIGTTLLSGSDVRHVLPVKGDNTLAFLSETPADIVAWVVFSPAVLGLDEANEI
jgi:hypothetical protein